MVNSASCATIVRLRFLSMYSNPLEFMYATGKIGLWSIIEEGIGIFAGSLPALRPLLSLPFLNGGGPATPASRSNRSTDRSSKFSKPRSREYQTSDIDLDKFHEDSDSQKHILRQTRVKVTNEKDTNYQVREWEKSQVLGWQNSEYKGRSEAAPVARNGPFVHGHGNLV